MWFRYITVIVTLVAIYFLASIIFIRHNQAGERLLVLHVPKYRRLLSLGLGTCLIMVGSYIMIQDGWYSRIGAALNSGGSFLWLQFFYPTEFRENGIIFSGTFVQWSQIRFYEWESERLLLKYKYWGWQNKRKIRVSSIKRLQVEQILRAKLVGI